MTLQAPHRVIAGTRGGLRLERRWASSALAMAIGIAALLVAVGCSAWIAVGAAHGPDLLELPTSTIPHWIDGPFRGLARGIVGPLTPSGFSLPLVALLAAYLLALTCAGSIPLRFALASIVLANIAFTLGPELVSSDVFGYIAYAREAALHGLNPYVSTPVSLGHDGILQFIYWKHQASPYGPLFTILSLPLGLISTAAALWSYKVVAGAASIAIAFLVVDVARRRGLHPVRATLFFGLNPVLLVYTVSGAHNDLLAVALVLAAVALVLRGRSGLGAGAAVAAAAIKLTLGLALPFVLVGAWRRGAGARGAGARRANARLAGARSAAPRGAALAILALGIPTLVLFGPHIIDQLRRISSDPQFDIAFSGPDRLATVLGTHIGSGVRAACTGAAAVAALVALVWAWRGADWITAAGWAFLALIAAIASLAPWYLVWLLPLAAVARGRALPAAALLATGYLIVGHLPALGAVPWLSPPHDAGPSVARVAPGDAWPGPVSVARVDQLDGTGIGVGHEHASVAPVDGHGVRLTTRRVASDHAQGPTGGRELDELILRRERDPQTAS